MSMAGLMQQQLKLSINEALDMKPNLCVKSRISSSHSRIPSCFQNSIRHNLSLHSRFVRVQNEGTGKSSWWMLNPDAKEAQEKQVRLEWSNTHESTLLKNPEMRNGA